MIHRLGALALISSAASFLFFCANLRAATFTVVNTNDSGAGSLSQAIVDANGNPGADVIAFNIAPGGVTTIVVPNFLPPITDPVTIDGATQPGYGGTPVVELIGAGPSVIGLLCTGGTNVIRGLSLGNFSTAIYFYERSSSNRVEGCWVGLDASGSVVRTNSQGVYIWAGRGNVIGGTNAASRNVIVGSIYSGVYCDGGGENVVKGNYIGIDPTGLVAMGNGWREGGYNDAAGIYLFSSVSNIIGGTDPGARNVLAGNSRGLTLNTRSHLNVVQGNWFGLDATGTNVPSGKRQLGGIAMYTDCNANIIGGTAAGAGNVLSGHAYGFEGYGITLFNGSLNIIQGNYIGTDASGTLPIGNLAHGLWLYGASRTNQIGGTTAAARNVISANGSYGIQLFDADRNVIQGNYIGTAADGSTSLGNGGSGIHFYNCQNVTIGGTTTAAGNVIAFNGTNSAGPFRDGITVRESGAATVFNPIRRNSIYSNAELGIRLAGCFGCIAHIDAGDTDLGPNDLQNPPTVTNAVTSAGSLTVSGRFNSKANQTYTLEFFASPEGDPSGYGEGKKYIGQLGVVTDAVGDTTFETFFVDAGYSGQFISATATDSSGNTSEFGVAVAADAPAGVLQLTQATLSYSENNPVLNLGVQRIGGDGSAITVGYSTSNGTATAGADYVATNGTLTLAAGVNSGTIQVTLINDPSNEPNETFTVTLFSPSAGAVIGAINSAELTIIDDDFIFLHARDAAVTKPATGSATIHFPIELSQPSTRTVTVSYATANITAQAGIDYQSATGSVTLVPGVTNVNVSVSILADGLQEGSKSFVLNLSGLVNATMGDSTALGTIYDGTQGVLQFSSATYGANESAELATITVTRSGGALGNVSVPFSVTGGSATAGADFTATNGVLIFNNGVTSRTFTVPIINDSAVEAGETVQLVLCTPTGTTVGAPSTAMLTITDNDLAPSLAIRATSGEVIISWPTQAIGFQLLSSPSITATNWPVVTTPPVVIGTEFVVTNSAVSNGFFWLKMQE